jgi:saccharopine dehydrogenase-like NADP-dependent oxidoreductase
VIALPDRKSNYRAVEQAIGNGLNVVDMLEEYHRRPEPYETEGLPLPSGMPLDEYGEWLHEEAKGNDVTVLDGMGLAPGLTNIALGEGIRSLDEPYEAVARVGGIPSKSASRRHPLRYTITWDFEHVLREYSVRTRIIRNSELIEVRSGLDRERLRFNEFGRDEELECAITPGMPSFVYTHPHLRGFAEKTIRWPGHWQAIETLKECGLLHVHPVRFRGDRIIPREFLCSLLTPLLSPAQGETDICVMYNTLTGTRKGKTSKIEYFMWDEADREHGLSAMQRTTGFPVAIAARMLARKQITQTGIVPPEEAVLGPLHQELMAGLAARGVNIRQTETET